MTTEQMRELDAVMAEKVMGWRRVQSPLSVEHGTFFIHETEGAYYHPNKRGNMLEGYHPTTDAAQALEVLRGIGQEREIVIRFTCGAWFVTKTVHDSGVPDVRCQVTAPTLELAICLFADELYRRQ